MSILVMTWAGSLAIMIGILFYGQLLAKRSASRGGEVVANWSDLIRKESIAAWRYALLVMHALHPHAKRAVVSLVVIARRSHDMFIERVFGHIEVEKGKTASFFLKRIAEHKEVTRGNIERGEAA